MPLIDLHSAGPYVGSYWIFAMEIHFTKNDRSMYWFKRNEVIPARGQSGRRMVAYGVDVNYYKVIRATWAFVQEVRDRSDCICTYLPLESVCVLEFSSERPADVSQTPM